MYFNSVFNGDEHGNNHRSGGAGSMKTNANAFEPYNFQLNLICFPY